MDEDYSSIEISPEQSEIQEIIFELSDIDISCEKRDSLLCRLKTLSKLSYIETILGYCASYEENHSSVLKDYLYELCNSKEIDLQLRLRCAESIQDVILCIKILNEIITMSEEQMQREEINFVIIIDYISKFREQYYEQLDILVKFCLTQKTINIHTKINLINNLNYNINEYINIMFNELSTATTVDKQLYTIVICQLSLKHNCLTNEIVQKLTKELTDDSTDENYKGNIADFMLGLSDEYLESIELAKKYISENTKGNLYTGKQMIHIISADAEKFIDCISEFDHDDDFFDSITKSNLFSSTGCAVSLARIGTDNSVYGKRSVNLKWIFCKSVKYIQSRKEKELLIERLVQELEDMSMTCSTGHLFRLMNTFSGLEDFIKIDPYDELRTCISTRLQKHISAMSEESAEIILNALMDQDELTLQKHLFPTFAYVSDELYNEYVKQGILSEHVFYEKYRESIMNFSVLQSKSESTLHSNQPSA